MKEFVKLFFVFVTGVSFAATPLVSSVYAEEGPETPPSSETEPTEPTTPVNPGEEWPGEIFEPIPEPSISDPTPTPVPEQAPKNTPEVTVSSPAPITSNPIETVVESVPETLEKPESTEPSLAPEVTPDTTEEDDTVYIPNTAHPNTARKIRLLALIATGIMAFTGLGIWAGAKLYKIHRTEKLYQAAIKKSIEIKEKNITRAG